MEPFKILFIEHEPDREVTKQGIKKVKDVSLETISDIPNMDDLYEKLVKNHYDLVITDTHFLEKDKTHDEENMDGDYLLPEIVNVIRSVDNKRTGIAVLTHFSNALLQQNNTALDKVDYLWDKPSSSEDFITWQINRIKEDSQRYFPGRNIFTFINEISGLPNFNCFEWQKDIQEMSNKILNHYRLNEQIFFAQKQLVNIASNYGVGDVIRSLLENIEETENYNIASKPSAWGHLKHVIYVYLLGYIIINSGIIDTNIFKNSVCPEEDSERIMKKKINLTWFLTALIHDIGIFAERIDQLIETSEALMSIYPDFPFKIGLVKGKGQITEKIKEYIPIFSSLIDSDEAIWYKSIFDNEENLLNHGILSGIALLIHFGTNPNFTEISKLSARAASLHNIIQPLTSEEKKKLKTVYVEPPVLNWKKYPFDCLLILCDQLQIWDRNTGQEKLFSKLPLESVELSDIQLNDDNILLKINYLPFRYISTKSKEYEELESKIEKYIDSKTIKSLMKIKDENFTSKIRVEFIYDGNYKNPLRRWPIENVS